MIVTCTMNPAIDLFVRTTSFLPKVVNRTIADDIQPNGKGVNVSFILKMLGIDNQAIGFSGGFTGDFIQDSLRKKGIFSDFVEVEGTTRINVFTKVDEEETEYKLVNQGPMIPASAIQELLEKIRDLTPADLLSVSGSNPQGVTDSILLEIAKISQEKQFRLVLDTSSSMLLEILAYRPYCIKPNEEELAALFGKKELTTEEIIFYGQELVRLGASHVIVSLAEKGAYYFSEETILYGNAPQGRLINSACAGDTLLGTFIGLLEKGQPLPEVLRYSIAAGSSTAFTEGLTDFKNVELLAKEVKIKKIESER